ncbi:MAG TPA: SRPBCC domain-containing protein [Candidatus Saccharimonadales bacterium]|nr:SRPBCC domain-containing protein [Candidatus Saccharimonadales bacterium]
MSDYPPLKLSRTFNAPIQAVWNAWTKPEEFKQWFMPAPFTVPNAEFDLQVGGKIQIDTKSPDGMIMPLVGEYKLIEEPTKLVMTNAPLDADGNKLFEIQHTVLFSEADGQTTLEVTAEVLFAGPNAKMYLDGQEAGLNQALDQLVEQVNTRS